MTISAALKEVYASAPTTQRFIETLALSHSLFAQTYYITNDNQNWTFLLEIAIWIAALTVLARTTGGFSPSVAWKRRPATGRPEHSLDAD